MLCYKNGEKNVPLITLLNHIVKQYDYKNVKTYYYSVLIALIAFDIYKSKKILSLVK